MRKDIKLRSTIKCPQCGYEKEETMPADACMYFYECTNCGALLKAKGQDCCVFCSYGTVKCPPMQEQELRANRGPSKSKKGWLSTLAGIPAVLAAVLPVVSCPLCWPFYTALLGSLGISFFNYTPYVVAIMAVLFAIAFASMYCQARKYKFGYGPLILASCGAVVIMAQKLFILWGALTYIGIAIFLASIIWNMVVVKKAVKECNSCH